MSDFIPAAPAGLTPARLRVVPNGSAAQRSQNHAQLGREAALEAIQQELEVLKGVAERCEQVAHLYLAPAGLRDLFARQAATACLASVTGGELLRRAREDGLL